MKRCLKCSVVELHDDQEVFQLKDSVVASTQKLKDVCEDWWKEINDLHCYHMLGRQDGQIRFTENY